jgi:radical SAM superfamily enzyme YgiQ (UPF0313 family)
MALIGRLLEAQGFRVGIISQPDWLSAKAFRALGKPNLFFGVTAGNMDSMVNRYTADRKPRSDDAYTPNGEANKRPDHAVVVYAQRCREAFPGSNVVIGSIEASLRRIAHYDYWSDKVRRSVLPDSKADLLIFGSAERAIVELAHRLAAGEPIATIRDLRGTAFMVPRGWLPAAGWAEIDATEVDTPGLLVRHADPYAMTPEAGKEAACASRPHFVGESLWSSPDAGDPDAVPVAPAHAEARSDAHSDPPAVVRRGRRRPGALRTRLAHLPCRIEPRQCARADPGARRARCLAQPAADSAVDSRKWTASSPRHSSAGRIPRYGDAKIPAFEMIRFSINIMRGCFGGCTFCSITEHEGRIIQSRSEQSILHEIEEIRDKTPGFTGIISDLGGPTANMYRLACKDPKIESACRRLSCVYPGICENLDTDHTPLVQLYRKARALPGVKKVLISSGLRYDLAVRDPQYVRELVSHHVGGYLKIAPEHTEDGPLAHMMKPGMSSYEQFRVMFEKFSKEAGKEQYLIPYFIAAHPGHHRPGHAQPRTLAQAQQFPPRSGTDLPADADGDRHGHVSQPQEPAEEGRPRFRSRRNRSWRPPAPPAQGFPALSRPRKLAAAARSLEADGARRPDRQRQEATDSVFSTGRDRVAGRTARTRTDRWACGRTGKSRCGKCSTHEVLIATLAKLNC